MLFQTSFCHQRLFATDTKTYTKYADFHLVIAELINFYQFMRIFFLILWAHQRVYSKKELGTLKLNTYKNAKVLDIFQRGALDTLYLKTNRYVLIKKLTLFFFQEEKTYYTLYIWKLSSTRTTRLLTYSKSSQKTKTFQILIILNFEFFEYT